MARKFDKDGFMNDVADVINRYSKNGGKYSNAEITERLQGVWRSFLLK